MSEPIRSVKFAGGRYDSALGMPLDSIDELRRLQVLLTEVGRGLFLRLHPHRARVSKDFREALHLRLTGFEAGSVIPLLEKPVASGQSSIDDIVTDDWVDQAFATISESISSLNDTGELSDDFPPSALSSFLQLGRSFGASESLQFKHGTSWNTFDSSTRRRLRRAVDAEGLESEEILLGQVLGLDALRATFRFKLDDSSRVVEGPLDSGQWDELKANLGLGSRAPLVAASVVVRRNEHDEVSEIVELLSLEPALPSTWSSRLDHLSSLSTGWLDGQGDRVPDAVRDEAELLLVAALDHGLGRPGIFPTPRGRIQLEWEFSENGGVVVVHGNGRFEVEVFDGDTDLKKEESSASAVVTLLHEVAHAGS